MKYLKWNHDLVTEIAKQYTDQKEFRKGNIRAFEYARRNGLLDSFFPDRKKNETEWTVDKVKEIASKYHRRKDFCQKEKAAAGMAYRFGIMDELYPYKEFKVHTPTEEEMKEKLKRCCHCKKELPKKYFHKNVIFFDGLAHNCKNCTNEFNRERMRLIKNKKTV
jgi:hypothetical protein